MEKVQMQSANGVSINIDKIAALFPNCVTETTDKYGHICKGIDFEKLQEELSDDIIGTGKERYQFTWPDKRKAIHLANTPTDKTLRPCREESVDFDHTQNLYIEGDNLEVLKLLRDNYLGGVKMIYIDPPYNTGNDFVYNDNFTMESGLFSEVSGERDEEGNRMVVNSDSNGRYHTDWLNMMYPRLKVARDLLSEDGVIFISIDDHEQENLKKICDEIFGAINFASPFIWSLPRGINAGLIARAHEYILCYTKNISAVDRFNRLNDDVEYSIERCNKKIDSRHPESTIDFPSGIRYEGPDKTIEGEIEGSETIRIIGREVFKNGFLVEPVTLSAGWTMKNMILDWLAGREVYDTKGQRIVEFFFKDNGKLYSKKELNTYSIKSILKDIADTQKARLEIEELFGNQDIFSYPKTVDLPKLFSKLSTNKDSLILDFFSGSATTAHAVMQLNADDGGKRKFIMVQLPEATDEKSEAYKAGYKNICEIGKERIRRAAKKIKSEMEAEGKDSSKMDFGFRVLKLDSSNMKEVYYTPQETNSRQLEIYNVKEDRTAEDLLFQVMPKCDLMLSEKIVKENIKGKDVYFVKDNYLAACFDKELTDEVITEIAKRKPFHFVMMEGGAKTDSVLDNFEQLFKTYSAGTKCMVI